jgi:ribosomal protein S12 methylthiotransferase accessory factor
MTADLAEAFTPLADSLRQLEGAASPLVGIVGRAVKSMHGTDESCVPNAACRVASARQTLGATTVEYGSGAHPDPARARAAAIGEALERYSATFVPLETLRLTTARELGAAAVYPQRFALFHPLQHASPGFPFQPFADDTPLHFVEGASLADGNRVYLPAQLVYLCPPAPTEPVICYATSSGLACAPTFEEAVLAALLELVERDAVMLAWNNRLSLPLLDWSGDHRLLALEQRFFRPTGLRYAVIDGSCFLDVPVAVAIVHGPSGSQAALALGAGCAATVAEACLRALAESFGVYRWLRMRADGGETGPLPKPEAIQTFDDHMRYYARDEQARLAAFLDASLERTPVSEVRPLASSSPRGQIDTLVAKLAARDVHAYAVDVTAPDVASLGVRVARVVAPELIPLDVLHTARFLGGQRLYTAAHEVGLLPAPLGFFDINPHPHPFP